MWSFVIMNLIGVFVLSALSTVNGGWFQDMKTSRGLDLGNGLNIRLDNIKRENASLFDRLALKLNYAGYGVSVGKALNKDAVEFGFYVDGSNQFEGRKRKDQGDKKIGEMIIPTIMGMKVAALTSMGLLGSAMMVIKALGVAKLALLVSGALLLSKLFHSSNSHPTYHTHPHIELEQHPSEHHPLFLDYQSVHDGGAYSAPSAGGNYFAYSNYAPSGHENVAESSVSNFAVVEAPSMNNNGTSIVGATQQTHQTAALIKRNDYVRRKPHVPPGVTFKQYMVRA